VFAPTTSTLQFVSENRTNVVGIDPNFALANGDVIRFTATWEIA
jgi:hypothetical protein